MSDVDHGVGGASGVFCVCGGGGRAGVGQEFYRESLYWPFNFALKTQNGSLKKSPLKK